MRNSQDYSAAQGASAINKQAVTILSANNIDVSHLLMLQNGSTNNNPNNAANIAKMVPTGGNHIN